MNSIHASLRSIAVAAAVAIPTVATIPAAALAQDYYGAIAWSSSTRSHGYSYDYATQTAAENRALNECESYSGAGDCQVLVWFRNACGALAEASNGIAGTGWGTDRSIAEDYAIQTCYDYGGNQCVVTRWVCTSL